MSQIKDQAEKIVSVLESRINAAQNYIVAVEPLILTVPETAPRVGSPHYRELSANYEKVAKLYIAMLETSRKLMLISQEETQRENMERDELYYFLKSLDKDEILLLRDYMQGVIRERVETRER